MRKPSLLQLTTLQPSLYTEMLRFKLDLTEMSVWE